MGFEKIQIGLDAQHRGFDAYAIGSLPDPALREIRSLLNIPVVGYGEAAIETLKRHINAPGRFR